MQQNNEDYIVLARKYRPKTLNDLIGQEVVATTIKNAFASNQIPHAYMLTGERGVGKTTIARIIAKGINCTGEDGTGLQTPNPCGKCSSCKEIETESSLDVIEMDAASNTSIDDVREIIEKVKYKPINARYKVFIIDEVHMLSKSAFNGLLKTLEEPPPHVKFIFATTEIKKVPITILSRCQRFNLNLVGYETLQNHLKNICNKEEVKYEDEAIALIAKFAKGSVRDSLSLLDQAISLCNKDLKLDEVANAMGFHNNSYYYDLFISLVDGNVKNAFEALEKIEKLGDDHLNIAFELLSIAHYSSVAKAVPSFFQSSNNLNKDLYENIASKTTLLALSRLWQLLSQSIEEIKKTENSKQAFDMFILKALCVADLDILKNVQSGIEKNTPNSQEPKTKAVQSNENAVIDTNINIDTNTINEETKPKVPKDPMMEEIQKDFPNAKVKSPQE